MDFLTQLNWRSAEKHFDPNKPLESEKLEKILHAIQMAPSSFGLQPYHVYVVSDPATKEALRPIAYGQAQVTDASHLLVFASRTDHMDRVEQYCTMATGGDASMRANMKGYEDMMRGFISNLSPENQKSWADRQAYIALGFALAAAAELGVSSCPLEGFDPTAFDRILQVPSNMKSVVSLSLGYSAGGDSRAKVRFPEGDLFTRI